MAASTGNTANDRRRPRPPGLTLPADGGFINASTPRYLGFNFQRRRNYAN
ncbi:hypothetical protein YC2023_072548 [Brassica napus]